MDRHERFRKRNLPHWELDGAAYFVTFRLAGSLPASVVSKWRAEREQGEELPPAFRSARARELHSKFDAQLDQGCCGARHLERPEVAGLVVGALRHFQGLRYDLPSYVVMPNHVHVLIQPLSREQSGSFWRLDELLHSIKSYTAKQVNRILGVSGEFWQREYYDHLVRDADEVAWYAEYIASNPVSAGLCNRREDWWWSSSHEPVPVPEAWTDSGWKPELRDGQ